MHLLVLVSRGFLERLCLSAPTDPGGFGSCANGEKESAVKAATVRRRRARADETGRRGGERAHVAAESGLHCTKPRTSALASLLAGLRTSTAWLSGREPRRRRRPLASTLSDPPQPHPTPRYQPWTVPRPVSTPPSSQSTVRPLSLAPRAPPHHRASSRFEPSLTRSRGARRDGQGRAHHRQGPQRASVALPTP